jgi:uncharacterized protein YjbI with pentapeptide repeats
MNTKFEEVDLSGAKISDQIAMDTSTFSGKLEMSDIIVGRTFVMRGKAKFAEVDMARAKIGGTLFMDGSSFSDKLNMDSVQVGQDVYMRKAEFAEVTIRSAKIGGQLAMDGSRFKKRLNVNNAQVEQNLFMNNTKFEEVDLSGAKISGKVDMSRSTFGAKLGMSALQVQEDLIMHDRAIFKEVNLSGSKVGGLLCMDGSSFSGKLDMNNLQVKRHLQMRNGATFRKDINLELAEITGNLELSGSTFASVSMREAKVVGALLLGPPAPSWTEGAKLTLQNAQVGFLYCSPDAWPRNIELDGFTYAGLGGLPENSKGQMSTRDVGWLEGWLKRQTKFTPQPYENLANVLEKEGHKGEAKDVLYAGKNRELEQTSGFFSRFWLFLQKIVIGFGYRIYYSFYWIIGFILLGMFVLKISKEGPDNKMPYGLAYSIDMLLPIVRLREEHYRIDLKSWARYYFYFHKMMGYVLASFLIAGLSGLTK